MKRMIGTVAAVALLASSAAYAQNTLPEIHQYFTVTNAAAFAGTGTGGATTSPADWATNPRVTVATGQSVYLAVWIRALQGNNTVPTQINSYNYEITGQGTLGVSTGGGDAAHRRQRGISGYGAIGPSPAAATDYADLPGADSQLFGQSGGATAAGTIFSNSPGDFNGAFLIDIIKIDITGSSGEINLHFTTPFATAANKYATQNTAASLNTVAFGANPTISDLDRKRASTPTADIVGTLADRVSVVPDAVLVIPEPGTLGLLALGLLAIRRRRGC